TLTFTLGAGAPAGASISTTGVFTWTPTGAQGPGTYPITIVVSDGVLTDSETITITVAEVAVPAPPANSSGRTGTGSTGTGTTGSGSAGRRGRERRSAADASR
ncbi:MAG: hypothetical protein U1E29_07805, partial [Coriobacteriia bacterium]|nr:hypothetical protein [Coriobacteriia bacterium]